MTRLIYNNHLLFEKSMRVSRRKPVKTVDTLSWLIPLFLIISLIFLAVYNNYNYYHYSWKNENHKKSYEKELD